MDRGPFAFVNVRVLDVEAEKLTPARCVRVEAGKIVGMCDGPIEGDRIIDGHGKTLMPGLIDCHVHVTAFTADFHALAYQHPTSYTAIRAESILSGMLHRGFTTVRDAGGADFGLARAVEEGIITGPRLFFCGNALSQTGGHGDVRHSAEDHAPFICAHGLGRVCDGVPEVRKACRDMVRTGATHLKLMVSGGVASPCDRIDSTQFSEEEILAAVQEAAAANIHVMAHAYTARAINRALACGVRSIEHGNLLDESSVRLFVDKGAFLVPTLATYKALAAEGREGGMPEAQLRKVTDLLDAGVRALELAHRSGVKICYGSDLLGNMHRHQLSEFSIRSAVQPPGAIIQGATCTAAALLGHQGQLGVVKEGAIADLLLVDGNPLEDLRVLQTPDTSLLLIMKGGVVLKSLLQYQLQYQLYQVFDHTP
eukprot:jgi/Mesvir1/20495/Mv12381-RA.1